MGCAHSQNNQNLFKRINGQKLMPQNKQFKVINIDDDGNEVSLGKIEITQTELILYQKEKLTSWPLRLLRKYGHDKNLFSFECGRRCVTGAGVYCFKCNEAEELFNVVKIASENIIHPNPLVEEQNRLVKSINSIINRPSHLDQENALLNNNQLNLPNSNHFYTNMRNYTNTEILDNCFIVRDDDSPLIKKEFDFELEQTNINSNYVKLQLKNKNNLNLDLVNPKNRLELSFNELDPPSESGVNYTLLDIPKQENHNLTFINSNSAISTAPPTPLNKTINDFKTTSEPNSPNEIEFSRKRQDSIQQYSLIDFHKTKALGSVINDKHY